MSSRVLPAVLAVFLGVFLAVLLLVPFGLMFAPLLRRMYGRTALPAEAPRPVTTGRRWLGMLVDLVSVTLLGGCSRSPLC